MATYKATVFIPTWFGEEYLVELLDKVLSQKVDFEYDVLVYDTSSTDKTPTILADYEAKHDNLRVKTISKQEFGHGKTRQAAANDSTAEYMVYLSQDAIPQNEHWLQEMVRPFDLNKNVVAVIGRQAPRPNAIPLLKNEINAVFSGLGTSLGTTLYQLTQDEAPQDIINFLGFYSDVNSAARRDILVSEIPYRDVMYAEDQLFGRDVITKGYIKAYAGRGVVVHSNDIKLSEYKHRMFDETTGLRRVGIEVDKLRKSDVIKLSLKGSLKDIGSILRDREYSVKRKIYWLVVNPFFHIQKWRGVRLGSAADIHDEGTHEKNSLEQRRRNNR